jgi:acyl-CoA synthetase (AMP-forming)/AMP-acid ligase II
MRNTSDRPYVVGLPDARLGESVPAWIRLRAGASAAGEEIREFCHGKIAHFKIRNISGLSNIFR